MLVYWVLAITFFLLLLFIYTWYVEPACLSATKHSVKAPQSKVAKPVRILFLSDIHCGRFLSPRQTERKLRHLLSLHRLQPFDLILLGGDYLDRDPLFLPDVQAFIQQLTRFKLPLYGVLGNHDYFSFKWDPKPITAVLEKAGLTLLRNQAKVVTPAGQPLLVIGLDDLESNLAYCTHQEFLPELEDYQSRAEHLEGYHAFDEQQPDLFRILISHNPDGVHLPGKRRPDLVLSGHTHGGQVAPHAWFGRYLPFMRAYIPRGSFGTWAGRQQLGQTTLLVSRGWGGALLPVRLGRLPEAMIITLVPS